MKALSFWPTWGELIAARLKWIETRSWSTLYRGPLAIANTASITPADVAASGLPEIHDGLRAHLGFTVRPMPATMRKRYRLGSIVATCHLAEVVPMVHTTQPRNGHCLVVSPTRLILHGDPSDPGIDVSDQLPYGDFAPGRFAWLLEDIKPTVDRCPRCWGMGWDCRAEEARGGPSCTHRLHTECPTCAGRGTCAPIPAKGRPPAWEWTL